MDRYSIIYNRHAAILRQLSNFAVRQEALRAKAGHPMDDAALAEARRRRVI